MKHIYTSQTYIETANRLDEACAWLDGLGITSSRTRVGKYQKILRTLAEHQKRETLDDFFKKFKFEDWVNAVHESAEIVRIHRGLLDVKDQSFVQRMKDATKGHELYVLDEKNGSGRDFSLELSVAAKFQSQGYTVSFSDLADIKVSFDSRPLYVECKRIKSQAQISKRVKEGLSQLHERYSNSESPASARGILVVSISKLVNAKLGLLEASSDMDLSNKATAHNANFLYENQELWKSGVDMRTLGLAVVLDVPGILSSKNRQLVTCHEMTITNIVPSDSAEHQEMLNIATKAFAGGT